jgi:hypothetical protein
MTARIEGVDEYYIINLPGIKSRWRTLGNQPVPLNAPASRIVSGDNNFSSKEVVAEPYLVL